MRNDACLGGVHKEEQSKRGRPRPSCGGGAHVSQPGTKKRAESDDDESLNSIK